MMPLILSPPPGELDSALREARNAPEEQPKIIVLAAGNYSLTGSLAGYYQLQANTEIRGAGMRETTVTLTDIVTDLPTRNGFNVAFTTWHIDRNNVRVANLTIDCNYARLQQKYPNWNLSLRGVMLFGSSCRVQNVRVLQSAGRRLLKSGQLEESFTIVVGAHQRDAYECLIENCVVERIAPSSYVSAISLLGTLASNARVIGGIIRGCRVTAEPNSNVFGLNLQDSVEAQFLRNYVAGTSRCLSNDTGSNRHLLVEENFFAPTACGIYLFSSQNATIRNNRFRLPRRMPAVHIGKEAVDPVLIDNLVILPGQERYNAVYIDAPNSSRPRERGTMHAVVG